MRRLESMVAKLCIAGLAALAPISGRYNSIDPPLLDDNGKPASYTPIFADSTGMILRFPRRDREAPRLDTCTVCWESRDSYLVTKREDGFRTYSKSAYRRPQVVRKHLRCIKGSPGQLFAFRFSKCNGETVHDTGTAVREVTNHRDDRKGYYYVERRNGKKRSYPRIFYDYMGAVRILPEIDKDEEKRASLP